MERVRFFGVGGEDVIEEAVPVPIDWRPLTRARARDSVRVDILSPENGAHLLHNPDQPAEAETVALRAAVTGPILCSSPLANNTRSVR